MQGVVDHIDHTAEPRKSVDIDRAVKDVREHPAGGRVDDHVRVTVRGIRILIGDRALTFAAADAQDLLCAHAITDRLSRQRSTARAEDQHLLVLHHHARALDQRLHPAEIGVVAAEDPITIDDGVHRADRLRVGVDLIEQRDHILLVGDGDIDRLKILLKNKVLQFFFF